MSNEEATEKESKFLLTLPENLKKILQKTAQEKQKTMTELTIEALKQYLNQYNFLDVACVALVYLNGGFHCVKNAPSQKKLGDGSPHDAKLICEACEEMKKSQNELIQLKTKLQEGLTLEIPYCIEGGITNEKLTQIYCPKIKDWRTIKQCKTLLNGANCKSFKYITITRSIGGK